MPIPGDSRSRPLQARDAIVGLTRRGEYPPGSRLPSERQLAEQLDVSRPTVREALRILEEEGQITRRVGIGTFVSEVPRVEAGLETLVPMLLSALSGQSGGLEGVLSGLGGQKAGGLLGAAKGLAGKLFK